MNRRDVLRKASAGIAASVAVAGTASAGDAGTAGECRDGCHEHCSDSGGCYCIC
jgi:hypothetical protein